MLILDMRGMPVLFVIRPKSETHWDWQPGCGLCHLIYGKYHFMFKEHSYRHLYTYIYPSCIKALISTCLIIPSSSVIMACNRGGYFYILNDLIWNRELNAGLPCLRRMICITCIPDQASKTFSLELIHFLGYKYQVKLHVNNCTPI